MKGKKLRHIGISFSLFLRPLLQGQCTVALKTLAHKCASLSLSHCMMDYSSVLLVLIIGSCTHSTGDSLFDDCLHLIVGVILAVILITVAGEVRKNEQTTETSEVLFPCC